MNYALKLAPMNRDNKEKKTEMPKAAWSEEMAIRSSFI